jgi:hypothetical protein
MKILKHPDNVVFDTENPNIMEFVELPTGKIIYQPLHERIDVGEWTFLETKFKPLSNYHHPIFQNFGRAFFYIVKL